jgi:arsenite oxidase small subunit
MKRLSRRSFLKLSGGGVAAGTVSLTGVGSLAASPEVDPGRTTLPYPHQRIVKSQDLTSNQPIYFFYPDPDSPCALIKAGTRISGGVGPDGDIVAYSVLCPHMGCPLSYDQQARTFKCPCHFSIFDPEMLGQMVDGQATENLPRIVLAYDSEEDSINALAVDGLIYGRQSNLL